MNIPTLLGRLRPSLLLSALIACLPLAAQTPLPSIPAGSVFYTAPEAANYGIVYELNIPNSARYNFNAIAYAQDNSALVPASGFTRIAYALELVKSVTPTVTQWVWVSFDRPANITSAQKIGVPNKTPASPAGTTYHYPNGTAGDTIIANMNIFSNVSGLTTGTAISTGNIEFWPYNYSQGVTAQVGKS